MRIAYRRMSGAVGLTLQERGTRGLWWEKRRALLANLQNRGHSVILCGRMTRESQSIAHRKFRAMDKYDLLMIEFGSSNGAFYHDDLVETQMMVHQYDGPIVFLCDDPDLPYLWKTVTGGYDRWSVWMNARYPQPFAGQNAAIRSFDFPFSCLQNIQTPSQTFQKDALVYIGRPGGRESAVGDLIQSRAPWRVYGRAKEWDKLGIPVLEAPDQPRRAEFYRGQIGSLVLADSKHKRLGWRTGRAYHALLAGCPAVVEVSHTALSHFQQYRTGHELHDLLKRWSDPEVRFKEWERQVSVFNDEKQLLETVFKVHGL